MGRTHRAVAAASSRRLLVLRLSVVPRLGPGPDGGEGRETKRGGGDRDAPLRSPCGGCRACFASPALNRNFPHVARGSLHG